MAINPYTLNNLYNQGLLDYVPYDLCNGYVNVSGLNGMQNPYLNNAMQGALYQNAGTQTDTFNLNSIGAQSTAGGAGSFGFGGIGTQSVAGGVGSFGLGGIGVESNAGGLNSFGLGGIGAQSTAGGAGTFGTRNISNGVLGVGSVWNGIPTVFKGLISGALIFGSLALCLRGKKKPPVENKTSFISKLNPINWFKKPKTKI